MTSATIGGSTPFVDLFTPLSGNNLIDQFIDPQMLDGKVSYYPVPTSLGAYGGNSSWDLAQWLQSNPLVTSNYKVNDPTLADPILGTPTLSWYNPGAAQSLAVFNSGTSSAPNYVYSLTDGSQAGEGDFFLQTQQPTLITANLSEMTNISLSMKLPVIKTTAETAFNINLAFTMNFNGAGGLPGISGFAQIVPFATRASGTAANSGTAAQYMTNYLNFPLPTSDVGMKQFIYDANLGDPILPSVNQDANSAPIQITYNLNKYAQNLVDSYFSRLPAAEQKIYDNLANWHIGGLYVGPASYNLTGGTPDSAKMTMQISNVHVAVNTGSTFSPTDSPAGGETVTGPVIEFTSGQITDTVEGAAMSMSGGAAYDRYLYTGNDSISLSVPGASSSTPWMFGGGAATDVLHGGSAADTLIGGAQGGSFSAGAAGSVFVLKGGSNTINGSLTDNTIDLSGSASAASSVSAISTDANGLSTVTLADASGNPVLTVSAVASVNQLLAALGHDGTVPQVSVTGAASVSFDGSAMKVGGSGDISIDGSSVSTSGIYSLSGAGSTDLITGNGNNTVYAYGGNDTIHTRGNSSVNLYATSDKLLAGSGTTECVVTGFASVDAVISPGTAGSMSIDARHAWDKAEINVNGLGGSVTFAGGAAHMAQMTLRGGTAGNNYLTGGNAPSLLIGGGSGDMLIAGGGTQTITGANDLFAAHGNETLIAASNTTDNLFQANGGIDFISSAGSGHQYFFTGNAASTLVGSTVAGSENIFFVGNPSIGAGYNDITNFRLGTDTLIATNGTSIGSIVSDTFNGVPGTLVSLTDGTVVFFQDLNAAAVKSIAAANHFESL